MSEIPAAEMGVSGTPGRGLCCARPVPLGQGGGIDCLCDCGLTTILHVETDGPLEVSREITFTCDPAEGGCGSAHWLVLLPLREGA
jgi:hypothetical protein